jgi:hypothetical protein
VPKGEAGGGRGDRGKYLHFALLYCFSPPGMMPNGSFYGLGRVLFPIILPKHSISPEANITCQSIYSSSYRTIGYNTSPGASPILYAGRPLPPGPKKTCHDNLLYPLQQGGTPQGTLCWVVLLYPPTPVLYTGGWVGDSKDSKLP